MFNKALKIAKITILNMIMAKNGFLILRMLPYQTTKSPSRKIFRVDRCKNESLTNMTKTRIWLL